jgi:hypothetical protein
LKFLALIAAPILSASFSAIAAEPVSMNDAQMSQIVAGSSTQNPAIHMAESPVTLTLIAGGVIVIDTRAPCDYCEEKLSILPRLSNIRMPVKDTNGFAFLRLQ